MYTRCNCKPPKIYSPKFVLNKILRFFFICSTLRLSSKKNFENKWGKIPPYDSMMLFKLYFLLRIKLVITIRHASFIRIGGTSRNREYFMYFLQMIKQNKANSNWYWVLKKIRCYNEVYASFDTFFVVNVLKQNCLENLE